MEEKDKNIETTEGTIEEVAPVEVVEEAVEEVAPAEPAEEIVEEGAAEDADSEAEVAVDSMEEPADQPKKKRKKWSKKKIALFCVVGFILLVAIAVGIFFLVGYLTKKDHNKIDRNFAGSAPVHLESTVTAESKTELDKAVASAQKDTSEMTEEDLQTIRERISYLYNLANDNKIHNTDQAIAFSQGDGGADLMSVEGNMFVRGFKVQAGEEYYYQKAALLYYCTVSSLQSALESSLNQQERAYADQEKDVYRLTGTLKGDKALIQDDDEIDYVPFIEVGVPSSRSVNKEEFYSAGYYLDDPREIQNLRVRPEYIVLDANSANEKLNGKPFIEYKDDTEFGMGYYICRFSLKYLEDGCVDTARAYLRDSAGSNNLQYAQYDVILEVWENGYLKRMYDDEQWAGDIKLPVLGNKTTTSTSWYEITMFYAFDETLSQYFTEADREKYEGDDWAAKIIADYKKQIGVK